MRPDKPLFNKGDLSTALRAHLEKVLTEIDAYNSNKLLNTSPDSLVDYFVEMHQANALKLDESNISVDEDEVQIDVRNDPMRFIRDRSRPALVPGVRLTFHLPYAGDKALFEMRPNSWTTVLPHATVLDNEVLIICESTGTDAAQIRAQFDRELDLIKKYVDWQHPQCDAFNAELRGAVQQRVNERRQRILANQGMAESLGFPIRKRDGAAQTYAVPAIRRKIVLAPPPATSATYQAEPTIADEVYADILKYLGDLAIGLERSPSAYTHMGEEQIRDHFLVALNATYEGRASGETFNFAGKTDILIREDGSNIFVAECKFWGGEKMLLETIDQLLSYLTWRDTKTAVLVFNRNRNLSAVLDKIAPAIAKHPQFKRDEGKTGETTFRYKFSLPGDSGREVHVAVMVFDVPQA